MSKRAGEERKLSRRIFQRYQKIVENVLEYLNKRKVDERHEAAKILKFFSIFG